MIGKKRKQEKIDEILNDNNESIVDEKEEQKELYSSNKPLWIQDVKKSIQYFPLSINELEFEKIEDIMNEDNNQLIINHEEYPFYTTIKKIMYSFGDVKEPNKKTIVKISNFINNYISLLIQIIQECDYKKIIEYLYKAEKEKLDSIKKYKHKSFFGNNIFSKKEIDLNFFGINSNNEENNTNNNIFDIDESLDELNFYGENEENNENNENIENKENNENNENNENKNIEKEIINNIDNKNDLNLNFEKEYNYENKKNKNMFNLFNNEKDDTNIEIALFQDKRTELMDSKTYEEYIKCRQQNFLSRGKKYFLNFLQNFAKEEKFPNEFKESNNIELISFILNEEIKKIITNSIRNKHPNKKLFILTQPLSPEDIEIFCEKEIQILSNFLNHFHNDIFMINEFKKKKINNKIYNKNAKVKNGKNGELYLIIKKFAFIHDKEESEFLSKMKSISETQVINGILKLREQLVKAKNQKINMREGLRNNKINHNKQNTKFIGIKEMIDFIGVDNYYEYFLCKDYIRYINLEEIKMNEFNSYLSMLNKINKKKISAKFDEWLNLNPEQKQEIKNEFKNYTSDVIQL